MVERTDYGDGELCWADVMARDPEASRRFYTAVFGWTYNVSGPEYGNYAICMAGGLPVAGMTPWQPGMGEIPAMWSLYLATRSADTAAEKITATGGQIMMGPMDIPNNGRMAFGSDPAGAVFGVWQAAQHIGFGRTGEPGSFAWGELVTRDVTVDRFYQGLFGYDQEQTGTADLDYTTWSLSGTPVCGRMAMPPEMSRQTAVPAHWALYFAVEDADAAIGRVTEAGGSVTRPPHDSPYGRLAGVADPEGAPFYIIDPTRTVSG